VKERRLEDNATMSVTELTRTARPERADPLSLVTDEVVRAFQRDGAVWIPGLLSPAWMRLIAQGVQRNINNPGPLAKTHYAGQPGAYYDDYCNYFANPEYQRLLADSPLVPAMAKVLQTKELWLFCDQIFVKEGGFCRRTRWHQDSPWWLPDGEKLGTMWIALPPLTEEETLEVIPGSFRGPIYEHGVSGMGVPTPPSDAPRIPDIESEREKWPILSHASQPGDVLIFHPSCLHGGASMREGGSRRSLSLRFYGDGVRYAERLAGNDPEFPGVSEALRPGDLLRHPWFPKLYPRPAQL
jgi:ectoine hydroxylase-related dioxygenase (phytanoyl-CoA dioxygenase family)